MTISIGAIALSEDVVWTNQFAYNAISQSVRPLLGGGSVVQQTSNTTQGREIELTAKTSGKAFDGYFTYLQVQQLKALEATGAQVTFVYNSISIEVVLKADGINVLPAIPRPDTADTDWYSGTITMIEV